MAYLFCHPAISQFSIIDISFNITYRERKIAQIAQVNQLFSLLNLVHIYSHDFYEFSRMLISKDLNIAYCNVISIMMDSL